MSSTLAEFLRAYYPQLGVGLGGLLLLLTVLVFLLRSLRDRDGEDESDTSEMMTKFREMHSRGDLSTAEYRTIKTVLATQLQDELNSTGEKG
jgi:hypothetical protein